MQARHDAKGNPALCRRARVANGRTIGNRPSLNRNGLRCFIAGNGRWILGFLFSLWLAALASRDEQRPSRSVDTPVTAMVGESDPPGTEAERRSLAATIDLVPPDQTGGTVASPDEPMSREQTVEGASESVTLVIDPGPNGGYFLRGTINQQDVVFMVDTGASWIVIPERLKTRLKLVRGRYVQVTTAGGVVGNYETQISSLALGPLHFRNVAGVLNPHAPNDLVLLGMSALKDIRIEQSGGRLTLTQPRSAPAEEQETGSPLPHREWRRSLRDCSTPGQVIDRRTLECMGGH